MEAILGEVKSQFPNLGKVDIVEVCTRGRA